MQLKSPNGLAHVSIFSANLIYGLNYIIAKGIMPNYFSPRSIIFFRVFGTMLIFMLIHSLFVKEKIQRKDIPLFMICSVFGIAVNQIMFFEGLNLTTAINSSIIMTLNPILVLVFSWFILKDKITAFKIIGLILGMGGAIILIGNNGNFQLGNKTLLGDIYTFINAASFALYLVIAQPLVLKYNPLTVMKWVFIFGFFWVLPFTLKPMMEVNYSVIPFRVWMSLTYIVIGATFFGYLLYNIGMRKLSPTVTSTYIYLQPFFATFFAYLIFNQIPTFYQIFASILIFIGVYLVSVNSLKKSRV